MKKNRTKEWERVKRIDWLIDRADDLTDGVLLNLIAKSKGIRTDVESFRKWLHTAFDDFVNTEDYVQNGDTYEDYFEKLGWPKDADK